MSRQLLKLLFESPLLQGFRQSGQIYQHECIQRASSFRVIEFYTCSKAW